MRRIGTQDGLFIPGNPATQTQGTTVTADWLNALQEELAGAVEGFGGTLDPADNNQLLEILIAAGLRAATDALAGVVELATNAESVSGESAVLAVPPAGLLAALTAYLPKRVFSSNDSVRIPDVSGGLIIKWGYRSVSSGLAKENCDVTFPLAFPNACFSVLVSSGINGSDLDTVAAYRDGKTTVDIGIPTAAGFEGVMFLEPSPYYVRTLRWFAIGN